MSPFQGSLYPRLQARSAPATSQALPARLPSAVLAQYSGRGALLSRHLYQIFRQG